MTEDLGNIRKLIEEGYTVQAIRELHAYIEAHPEADDTPFYLLGNAHRKHGDWQMALNNYLEAIDRNPESPAVHARAMLMDILEFYNKDMYNQ
jgi:tetratricopeptide (TPR) repeat protein